MKTLFLLPVFFLITLAGSAQVLKTDESVEVEPLLKDSATNLWKKATVTGFDTLNKTYLVKLEDGKKMAIPSKTPEKWIRPQARPLAMLGPSRPIRYENRDLVIKAFSCRPSETYVKKNVKADLAMHFKEYGYLFVDFTSFKGQKGFDDPKVKGMQVFPYKIEFLAYLKRTLFFGGKAYTEYQTWEFDRVYEYATRPGKQCEFRAVPSSDAKLISSGWFE